MQAAVPLACLWYADLVGLQAHPGISSREEWLVDFHALLALRLLPAGMESWPTFSGLVGPGFRGTTILHMFLYVSEVFLTVNATSRNKGFRQEPHQALVPAELQTGTRGGEWSRFKDYEAATE